MSSIDFLGFNDHSKLKGCHALLGASKFHWLNYDEAKTAQLFLNFKAAERGTELHDFAQRCIELSQKLPHSQKTLNMYVNDAIGFRLKPEQVLFYSEFCFGTADAIGFHNNVLHVFDLKTGTVPAHIEQLMIYAALFCLEYRIDPLQIRFDLRIYQNDSVRYEAPEGVIIRQVCDKIVESNKIITSLKGELNNG